LEAGLRPRSLPSSWAGELRANLGSPWRRPGRGEAGRTTSWSRPPGLGKTNPGLLYRPRDWAQALSHLGAGGGTGRRPGGPAHKRMPPKTSCLSTKSIALPTIVAEILYPAMEETSTWTSSSARGRGPAPWKLDLPNFTLVGATTRAGSPYSALRDRFGLMLRVDFYRVEQNWPRSTARAAQVLGVEIDADGTWEISRRSRARLASPTVS